MNDIELKRWIENDEYLYRVWLASRMSLTLFVKETRKELDEYIANFLRKGAKK